MRTVFIWAAIGLAVAVPLLAAAMSPLLAFRSPIYIASSFAAIAAFALLLVQPLLAAGILPGMPAATARRVHRWLGLGLVTAVVAHVAGLWLTSPPDVIDALLFRSPTAFTPWGVVAMWAIFATAAIAAFRRRVRIGPRTWRRMHVSLALVIVGCTVMHAVLIEGAMELLSKLALSGAVILATGFVALRLRVFARR